MSTEEQKDIKGKFTKYSKVVRKRQRSHFLHWFKSVDSFGQMTFINLFSHPEKNGTIMS